VDALTQELAALRGEEVRGLVTTVTGDSPLNLNAIHQLAPGDTKGSVQRFFDYWRPDAGVVIDAPDRPELITRARASGLPMFLAASARGRIAPDGKISYLSASLMENFDKILLPSAAEAQAFHNAGLVRNRIQITGPLSDTLLAPPCDTDRLDDLFTKLAGRPIWLAARVSVDEVALVEAAQRRTIRAAHRLMLLIIPRDASDGPRIADALAAKGWRTALLSRGEEPDENIQVFIADAPEDEGLWYRLAPTTYLGGSFDPTSVTTDPFLPATLGSAVIHGPHAGGSAARLDRLRAADATLPVASPDGLGEAVFQLLSPDKAARLAHAGWTVTTESAQVVERLVGLIDTALDAKGKD
jgi:3-deoxy-D-manno-octulosonic-acid transferase